MTRSYSEWRLEKLSDPKKAARYLNAAKKDSKEAFLHALKNVIQANQVARVAREAGVSRESVYRSFSAEGNPTYDTLSAVLEAVDIDFLFTPIVHLGSQSGRQAGGTIETETLNGNVSKLFIEGGAVRYLLPDVVNVPATGANLYSVSDCGNWQLGAAPQLVNVQEQVSGTIPFHLLIEEKESGSYRTASAALVS
jgi:probable addiction module antidote protein